MGLKQEKKEYFNNLVHLSNFQYQVAGLKKDQ